MVDAVINTLGPDGAWDGDGGPPCPRVCMAVGTETRCTAYVKNTLRPVWNHRFPAMTASALRDGVPMSIIDVDTLFDDSICDSGRIVFAPEAFATGRRSFGCIYATVNLTLTPE